MGLKTGDLDLQGQIGLEISTAFEKLELCFVTPLNLNCTLVVYWFKAGGGLQGV